MDPLRPTRQSSSSSSSIQYVLLTIITYFVLVSGNRMVLGNHIPVNIREYGESCTDIGDRCNPRSLLTCHSGTCNCSEPNRILWDEALRKCVARVGKNCGPMHSKYDGGKPLTLDCPEEATCDGGFCVCGERFYGGIKGTCLKKKVHGEPCFHDRECDISFRKTMVCEEGRCECDARIQIFDEERKVCVGLVGSECDVGSYSNECTEHAECRKAAAGDHAVCVCRNGFAETSNATCDNDYGQACGANYPCSDIQLACINGKCTCQLPLHQIYDKKAKECLSLVSGPCTIVDRVRDDATDPDKESRGVIRIEQRCVKNSQCIDRGYYNECICKKGYVQTKGGECAPGFGESCEADECDPITPLFCRNGKCSCQDMLQVYEASTRKCVGLVGSRCSLTDPLCVESASCVLQPNTDNTGRCVCDRYAKEQENRTCYYPGMPY